MNERRSRKSLPEIIDYEGHPLSSNEAMRLRKDLEERLTALVIELASSGPLSADQALEYDSLWQGIDVLGGDAEAVYAHACNLVELERLSAQTQPTLETVGPSAQVRRWLTGIEARIKELESQQTRDPDEESELEVLRAEQWEIRDRHNL